MVAGFKSLTVLLLLFALFCAPVDAQNVANTPFRVLSWNISGNGHERNEAEFRAALKFIQPDIVVLDEALPTTSQQRLLTILNDELDGSEVSWSVDFGVSGGRQRGVIASRWAVHSAQEFDSIRDYPARQRERIGALMSPTDHLYERYSMDGGIAANAAFIEVGDRLLLVASVDLQCCGGEVNDWYERRRRVESSEIRRWLNRALARQPVHGLVVAGDFNAVAGPVPRRLITGPYRIPHHFLRSASVQHLDGVESWTWDGSGTPFESSALDGQYYGPPGLTVMGGFVFDSEDLDGESLDELAMDAGFTSRISRHRPVVVDYLWR